jgi:hypothetical protein
MDVHKKIHWAIAYVAVVVSASIAARYGVKVADTEIDAWLRGGALFIIAVISAHGAAWAARCWLNGHRPAGVLIGLGSIVCFVVTLAGGIGTIAVGADKFTGDRAKTIDTREQNKADLERLRSDRAKLPAFKPMTQDGVDAASDAVDAAENTRKEECTKRGAARDKCRQRETEEADRRSALVKAIADKAATDAAAKIDARIEEIAGILDLNPAPQSKSAQGAFLARILPLTADEADAWYALGVSLAMEISAMLAMLSAEINAGGIAPRPPQDISPAPPAPAPALPRPQAPPAPSAPAPAPDAAAVNRGAVAGNGVAMAARKKIVAGPQRASEKSAGKTVAEFGDDRLELGTAGEARLGEVYRAYLGYCADTKKTALDAGRFLPLFVQYCQGRKIIVQDHKGGVRCVGVKLIV